MSKYIVNQGSSLVLANNATISISVNKESHPVLKIDYIGGSATYVDSTCRLPRGNTHCTREYLQMLDKCDFIDFTSKPFVELEAYEALRAEPKPTGTATKDEFFEFLFDLLAAKPDRA